MVSRRIPSLLLPATAASLSGFPLLASSLLSFRHYHYPVCNHHHQHQLQRRRRIGNPLHARHYGSFSVPTTTMIFQTPKADTYLEQVLTCIEQSSSSNNNDSSGPNDKEAASVGIDNNKASASVSLTITQAHVKTMIRCLLRLTKVEFDKELRDYIQWLDWKDIYDFVPLLQTQIPVTDDLRTKAPNFEPGLRDCIEKFQTLSTSPKLKVFPYLARGKAYQGKLERLLEDQQQPELTERYIKEIKEPAKEAMQESKLLQKYVDYKCQEAPTTSTKPLSSIPTPVLSESIRQSLHACATMKFPKAPYQPADGGKASGIQGEADLVTYLKEKYSGDDENILILAPVYILHNAKTRNMKKCPYALQVSKRHKLNNGMTTEWDAVVAIQNPTTQTVRILQVWESKASLNVVTIYDALMKKYASVKQLFSANPEEEENGGLKLFTDNEEWQVDQLVGQEDEGNDDKQANSSPIPQIGIYGSNLKHPNDSAKQAVMVGCEKLLERDPTIVQEQALTMGTVSFDKRAELLQELVVSPLEILLQLARDIEPLMVVMSDRK